MRLVLLLLLLPAPALAQAWAPEAGAGYAKVGVRWLPGFGYHRGPEQLDGQVFTPAEPYGAYHEVFVEGYVEAGLGKGVAVWSSWQTARLFLLNDPVAGGWTEHASVGEPTLGFRGQVARVGRIAITAGASARPPGGNGQPVQEVFGTEAGNPRLGALRIHQEAWGVGIDAALGAGWKRVYLVATLGWTAHTHDWDSVLEWTGKAGFDLGKGWGLSVRLAGRHPLGDGTAPYTESPSGIGNGARYLGLTLEAEHRFANGVGVGLSGAAAFGTSVRQTSGPVITVFASFVWPPR